MNLDCWKRHRRELARSGRPRTPRAANGAASALFEGERSAMPSGRTTTACTFLAHSPPFSSSREPSVRPRWLPPPERSRVQPAGATSVRRRRIRRRRTDVAPAGWTRERSGGGSQRGRTEGSRDDENGGECARNVHAVVVLPEGIADRSPSKSAEAAPFAARGVRGLPDRASSRLCLFQQSKFMADAFERGERRIEFHTPERGAHLHANARCALGDDRKTEARYEDSLAQKPVAHRDGKRRLP